MMTTLALCRARHGEVLHELNLLFACLAKPLAFSIGCPSRSRSFIALLQSKFLKFHKKHLDCHKACWSFKKTLRSCRANPQKIKRHELRGSSYICAPPHLVVVAQGCVHPAGSSALNPPSHGIRIVPSPCALTSSATSSGPMTLPGRRPSPPSRASTAVGRWHS